jgi:hypothetical protein
MDTVQTVAISAWKSQKRRTIGQRWLARAIADRGAPNAQILMASPVIVIQLMSMQNGGYRLSSGTQRKLQSVTGAQWLRTPDRRLCAGGDRARYAAGQAQNTQFWL